MRKYDIFISYRREGGFDTAKHLYDLLTRDGYRVSFDIDTLRNGDFDTQLYKRIDDCTDFILVVDQHTFDRTIIDKIPREKDWLRCELAYALEKNKNIIPIFLSGGNGFPEKLPNDIIGVTRKNGPEYNRYYFDDFYRTLKKRFLHNKRGIWKKLFVMIISGCLICGVFFFMIKNSRINDYIGSEKIANNNQLSLKQYLHNSKNKGVTTESKPLQNLDTIKKENTNKEDVVLGKYTSSTSQTNYKSNTASLEKPIQSEKTSSSKFVVATKAEKPKAAPAVQNSSFRVYDIDELMKLAASGDPRAYVPLAKYYYRNASGMSSYERVHIYSMKAISSNVDVDEAKKLISNIDALGFYSNNDKYSKPKL